MCSFIAAASFFGALPEQMTAVPAGDKGQTVTLEHRCQDLRIARKFTAEFDDHHDAAEEPFFSGLPGPTVVPTRAK